MPDGPCKGETISIDEMLEEYYKTRGWDTETGIPTKAKLNELGLTL
jgi:aldehyde:ferredoxin oxidoreductase